MLKANENLIPAMLAKKRIEEKMFFALEKDKKGGNPILGRNQNLLKSVVAIKKMYKTKLPGSIISPYQLERSLRRKVIGDLLATSFLNVNITSINNVLILTY